MARYPESFIEEIRGRADLLEVVGRYVHLKKQGSSWLGLCPFHDEKTPSFNVRPDRGFYKCFGCGAGGDLFGFLMKKKGLAFLDAVEEIAVGLGVPLPVDGSADPRYRQKKEERQQLLDVMEKARNWFHQQLRVPGNASARQYLQHRGLRTETIEQFGLGYAPPGWRNLLNYFGGGERAEDLLERSGLLIVKGKGRSGYDRFRDRIIFPIRDYRGHCLGFGGRLLAPGEPKYINSPETLLYRKGEILYGLDHAQQAIQEENQVIVVEGYMDLVALANHGIKPVVATLGTALTASHLQQLWKRTRRICFCFDGDVAGSKAAWRALERVLDGLEADRHATFLFLPEGKDPDDVVRHEGAQGFRVRVEKAASLMDFILGRQSEGLDVKDPEGRAALAHRVRPLLAKVADSLLRKFYNESLEKHLGITQRQHRTGDVPARAIQPPYLPRTAAKRYDRVLTTAGRDFEQVLLAILLRAPELIVAYEEELSQLELVSPPLSRLLSELIDLGSAPWFQSYLQKDGQVFHETQACHGQSEFPFWRRIPVAGMVAQAEEILRAEEVEPKLLQEEFCGCLLNCQLRHLQRQRDQVKREIESGSGDSAHQFSVLQALKQEQKRLRQSKCCPISPITAENRPA